MSKIANFHSENGLPLGASKFDSFVVIAVLSFVDANGFKVLAEIGVAHPETPRFISDDIWC